MRIGDIEFASVTDDSRKVSPGCAFVAIPGVRVDGARFARAAIERGAAVVIGEGECPDGVPPGRFARVGSARLAIARLAGEMHGNPSHGIGVFAVTGTNGKTTVATAYSQLSNALGRKCGLISTVKLAFGDCEEESEHTTPDAVTFQRSLARMRDSGCTSAAVEVSSHALSQFRADGTRFKAAAFTNLTRDHLDYHGTMEEYGRVKARLFDLLFDGNKDGVAVVNSDDAFGARLCASLAGRGRVISYGLGADAELRAVNVATGDAGSFTDFDIELGGRRVHARTSLIGLHNVCNLLAVAGLALADGFALDEIARAIPQCGGAEGRLQRVVNPQCPARLFVDYAHTPDALERVLAALRKECRGRLIVVFGCGGDRDRGKRPQMGAIAGAMADCAIVTSDNPRSEEPEAIIAEILAGFKNAGSRKSGRGDRVKPGAEPEAIPDRAAAIRRALAVAKSADDIVLVAGKGHEKTQETAGVLARFSDAEQLGLPF